MKIMSIGQYMGFREQQHKGRRHIHHIARVILPASRTIQATLQVRPSNVTRLPPRIRSYLLRACPDLQQCLAQTTIVYAFTLQRVGVQGRDGAQEQVLEQELE